MNRRQIVSQTEETPPTGTAAQDPSVLRARFTALYRAGAGRVYAICLRMLGDPDAARDASQTAFLKAWQSLDSLGNDGEFLWWMRRITVNVVIDHLRSAAASRADATDREDMDLFGSGDPPPDPGRSIDLEDAIRSLPPGARAVVVLHDIEGFRHEEIAAALGVTVGTSKAQLHRARRLLRERLES